MRRDSIKYLLPYGRGFDGIIEIGIKKLARLSLEHNLPAIIISPTVNRNYSALDKALVNLNMPEKYISKLNSRNRGPAVPFVNAIFIQRESSETMRKMQGEYVGFAFSCHEDDIKKIERAPCLVALIIAAWDMGYEYFNNKWNPMLLNYE